MADLSTNEEKLLGSLVREKYGLELIGVQFRNLARLTGKYFCKDVICSFSTSTHLLSGLGGAIPCQDSINNV